MRINPKTNHIELTPDEVKKAVCLYLKQGFQISCEVDSVDFLDNVIAESIYDPTTSAVIGNWTNDELNISEGEDDASE